MNATTSFTPGPWHTPLDTQYGQWVRAADQALIARVHQRGQVIELPEDDKRRGYGLDCWSPETEANAHLIAAAPALLEAAARAERFLYANDRTDLTEAEKNSDEWQVWLGLRTAIAAARGEA